MVARPNTTGRRLFRRKKGRARSNRWRAGVGLAAAGSVLALSCLVYLHVTVTRLFEGRLWKLPSLVYSSGLELVPGDAAAPGEVAGRLERTGYAKTPEAPSRPGEYRRRGEHVDVYLRALRGGERVAPSRQVRLRFEGSILAAITDATGRPLRRLVLEPEVLATLFGPRQEERLPVRLDEVPAALIDAVLAAEDSRFYSHQGLDATGILRAAWANVREGQIVQGGSTITQQTVKNLYLGQERTWWRKLREAALSLMVEARYPKRRILEIYLNEVYLGQRGPVSICGVQAASRFYFGRDVSDLSLAESALLAGMIRSPGHYNPFADVESALARRERVFDAMVRLGLASPEDVERARGEKLRLASGSRGYNGAPWVVQFVRSQLAEVFSPRILEEEGLTIHTTLDTGWQRQAESALKTGLERLERDVGTVRRQMRERRLEGAVLVTRPSTGEILAMVGGRDYKETQFNRVAQARRQPGSSFKPFVYLAGFEQSLHGEEGLTPATLLDDSPLEMASGGKVWQPANYDRLYRGPVSARRALEESLNVPTVRAAQLVGAEAIIDSAHRAGITSPLAPVPALALGVEEVTPLELANAYGTLSQLGRRAEPWIIREVVDREGRVLARGEKRIESTVDARAAYLVGDLLRGVFDRGTARSALALGHRGPAAGKTGTTDDTRDAWFVGYTPHVLGLVWIGYDDNARTGLTGATGALPIWVQLMQRDALAADPGAFEEPGGIVHREIDPATGMLAVRGCPEMIEESFAEGTEPSRPCVLHRGGLGRWLRRLLGRDPGV